MVNEDNRLSLAIIRHLLISMFCFEQKHGYHANSETDALQAIRSPRIRRREGKNRRSCHRAASYGTRRSPFKNFRAIFCAFSSASASFYIFKVSMINYEGLDMGNIGRKLFAPPINCFLTHYAWWGWLNDLAICFERKLSETTPSKF